MFGGFARSPVAISNIPTNGYMLFPNSDDGGNWYSKDWQGNVKAVGALNPVVGSQRVFGKRTTTLTNDSNAFEEYHSITINNNTSNPVKHEGLVNFVWGHGSASNDIRVRIMLNGVQQGDELRIEPKDPGTDQRNFAMWFDEIDLPAGNNTLSIEFAASANGNQSRMYSAKMRSMRVE